MELLQPLGILALITTPAIVSLYFLRKRLPPKRVGSLILWQVATTQLRRGNPWGVFRPRTLLIVQLIVAGLIALALTRPACVTEGVGGESTVIILDASASMAATDLDPSRWHIATSKAREIIASAPIQTTFTLLRAGQKTRIVTPKTRDRGVLYRALDRLAEDGPDTTPGLIKEALLLGLQQVTSQEGGDPSRHALLLLSDGAFDRSQLPPVGDQLSFIPLGSSDDNMAISMFGVRQAAQQSFHAAAVATVTNTGSRPLEGHLRISLNDTLLEAYTVTLGAGEQRTLQVPVDADAGTLTARIDGFRDPTGAAAQDLLSADNVAYAVIAPKRSVNVLLVGDAPLVARALSFNPRITLEITSLNGYQDTGKHDVVIFVRTFPQVIPQGRFLVIAPPDENPLVDFTTKETSRPLVSSWDRGHPSLLHVDLGDVKFDAARTAIPRQPLIPLAEFSDNAGGLLFAGKTPSWRGLVWTVDPMDSNLPLLTAFPIFLYNAIGWLCPGETYLTNRSVTTGTPLTITARQGDSVTIKGPTQEKTVDVDTTNSDGAFLHYRTQTPGFYHVEVASPGEPIVRSTYGVSMTDLRESQIAPVRQLSLSGRLAVEGSQPPQTVKAWLPSILLALFALICTEWILYLRERQRARSIGEGL